MIPFELFDTILYYVNDIDVYINLYLTCKYFKKYFDKHKEYFCKKFLDIYNVKYKNPTDFIYIQNNVRENWYRVNPFFPSKYNYIKIFKLYMKWYFHKSIDCSYQQKNGYSYNKYTRTLYVDINTININRIHYADEDYYLQCIIYRLKQEWERLSRSCDPISEHHHILIELKYAYNALLFSQHDYEQGDSVHEYWGTSFSSDSNTYEYQPHVTPMAYITSIPFYPHLQELICYNQPISYTLSCMPNTKIIH